jgi:histidinol phosphatase-like enzyme (inositol monophosphatase family)
MNSKNLYSFIRKLALESGKIIRSYFRQEMTVELKKDLSPVTVADKKAEERMREMITRTYPEHGILGEEMGSIRENAEYLWVLDPIDGTRTFISGVPLFGTLIALLRQGKPVLGALNLPVLNELLIGDNNQTRLNGKPVACRILHSIADALLLTTDPAAFHNSGKAERFGELVNEAGMYRTWGDCYGYYLVASGYADIMIDPVMAPWDIMALIPIIRGAGGIITDMEGKDPLKGESIVAGSRSLHATVIQYLNS